MATTGIESPGRAQIGVKTLRTDRWWIAPLLTFLALTAFVVYSGWRVFSNQYYFAEPYISVYYSPCITTTCVPGSGFGDGFVSWWALSPALLTAWIPLAFRFTCYYYRKAYFRSFWLSPPACAVAEPHGKYTGERRLPLILNNGHRYAFYLGLLLNVVLTWDAIIAFRNSEGQWGHMGLGTVILVANAVCLWMYSLSCHSCRNAVGGRITHFSKHPLRYRMWTLISKLNTRHMQWAWISLCTVVLADFYVYLLASGRISDLTFF
ncbi:unannotated protein [freshwater metagenome]|jgi:hypothetical protein|uniref:Unannotated protein n=1 Tax=freshwater metagenome TaxID=449393 RepID=A0A6J7BWX0_9ZZZZ|nr:hypothetical protein [Actinomycetota bacterium]MSW36622.1 hypothetical protein [Actinomycetota bacterium]MSX38311.1 hypothetical protein [Actinomycetota bacterium]